MNDVLHYSEDLRWLKSGLLPERARLDVLAHLVECDQCRDAYDAAPPYAPGELAARGLARLRAIDASAPAKAPALPVAAAATPGPFARGYEVIRKVRRIARNLGGSDAGARSDPTPRAFVPRQRVFAPALAPALGGANSLTSPSIQTETDAPASDDPARLPEFRQLMSAGTVALDDLPGSPAITCGLRVRLRPDPDSSTGQRAEAVADLTQTAGDPVDLTGWAVELVVGTPAEHVSAWTTVRGRTAAWDLVGEPWLGLATQVPLDFAVRLHRPA